MIKRVLVVGVVACAVLAGRLEAQGTPDLSGRWVPVPDQTAAAESVGELRLTQDASSLTVEMQVVLLHGSVGGGRTTMTSTVLPDFSKTVYQLDGSDTTHAVPAPMPAGPSGFRSNLVESASRAAWTGRKLVIVTHNVYESTLDGRNPRVIRRRQTVRRSYSIEPDSTLLQETLIVADPTPSEQEQPTPSAWRRVYRKAS